jgi:nitroreductase
MDFYDVIETRRSVRRYADRPVDPAILERILNAARLAPSANNAQPWHFVVVRDGKRRRELAELCGRQTFIGQAPVVIAACGRSYRSNHHWIADHMALVDVTIAMDHLTLAARAEGLGTCWIGAFDHDPVHRFLEVPATHRVGWLTPLGYPADKGAFGPTDRRNALADIVSYETFGGRERG